jgi:hypothetical protein
VSGEVEALKSVSSSRLQAKVSEGGRECGSEGGSEGVRE